MIHNLYIQRDVDYYVMTNVRRPYDAAGHTWSLNEVRYVNTFLHPGIPQSCTGTFRSSFANSAIACPEGVTQPLSAPPPLKQNHQNYNSTSLNDKFRRIVQEHPDLTWNFREAVYVHPTYPERVDEYLAMRCLAHTYGGRSVRIQNLQELINTEQTQIITDQTQIIGLLGHGGHFLLPEQIEQFLGRIIIGQQQIVAGDWPEERLASNQVRITDSQIQENLRNLGRRISPRAVIVLYHCYNGICGSFIQELSNLVDKPVFAYTGFLGWYPQNIPGRPFTVDEISNDWAGVQGRLLKQEFNYQPENIRAVVEQERAREQEERRRREEEREEAQEISRYEGDWVAATPDRFDPPPFSE